MNIQKLWYQKKLHPLLIPLLPLSWAFQSVIALRRSLYQRGINKTYRLPLPVIIVGNITVGGTGKTPFVIWLANFLRAQGKKPGIATRGIGGNKKYQPCLVTTESNPFDVGDEAVLLARRTDCPVVICIDRVLAAKKLAAAGCDMIICDDGLQHYQLGRDIEIAMIDGERYFGNGFMLPAGPLREPQSRLDEVDFVVLNHLHPEERCYPSRARKRASPVTLAYARGSDSNAWHAQLKMDSFVSVRDETQQRDLSAFSGLTVHAVAGIGNPERFFSMLRNLGIIVIPHIFPDHHAYQAHDFNFLSEPRALASVTGVTDISNNASVTLANARGSDNSNMLPVIMTEKDAVKCGKFANAGHWYLRVNLDVDQKLQQDLLLKITGEHYETII